MRALPPALSDLVLNILRAHPQGLSEHDLFAALAEQGHPQFGQAAFAENMTLFQAHFLLFHLLYGLRDQLRADQQGDMDIGCTLIVLRPFEPKRQNGLAPIEPLRDYYGDLNNLQTTGPEELECMLRGFWRRFPAQGQRHEALATLGLAADADTRAIKNRYRDLALAHHPDRGGDAELLSTINAAMQVLRAGGV